MAKETIKENQYVKLGSWPFDRSGKSKKNNDLENSYRYIEKGLSKDAEKIAKGN